MNDTDSRSMDDVLASIRRIVRAEKEAAVATGPGDEPPPESHRRSDTEEEPLVLTPEMRLDAGAGESGAADEPAADEPAAETLGTPGEPEATISDREALRSVLRDLLREELSGGDAEGAVRGIIRDELTRGQVGSNISQNVLRMIRAEVAKALQAAR